jgi:hypothetical protein
MIHVKVELTNTSQPIERDAENTYVKGPFYCVYGGGKVEKYPVASIFRVTEDYS